MQLKAIQMYRHAKLLREQHMIEIHVNPLQGYTARAYRATNSIYLNWPVVTEKAYAVFLHELGHLVSPSQSWMAWARLQDEIDAWSWAMQNARFWTPRMTVFMQHSLRSYGIDLEVT
jgi:hypothetical protein